MRLSLRLLFPNKVWARGEWVKCSPRYMRGVESYGKKVKSEKRKARILAELKAMGVKPRVRRKMSKYYITLRAYHASLQDPKRAQRTRSMWRSA